MQILFDSGVDKPPSQQGNQDECIEKNVGSPEGLDDHQHTYNDEGNYDAAYEHTEVTEFLVQVLIQLALVNYQFATFSLVIQYFQFSASLPTRWSRDKLLRPWREKFCNTLFLPCFPETYAKMISLSIAEIDHQSARRTRNGFQPWMETAIWQKDVP